MGGFTTDYSLKEQADYNNIFKLSEEEGKEILEETEKLQTRIISHVKQKMQTDNFEKSF